MEKVISDTECLFKSREKEYQETIDQIEVRYVSNAFCCRACSNDKWQQIIFLHLSSFLLKCLSASHLISAAESFVFNCYDIFIYLY